MNTNSEIKKATKEQTPTSTLKQILARSKLINEKIISSQELPAIERGLDQIEAQSAKLSHKTSTNDEDSNGKAHYFLAQGGVDTQVLIKDLGSIHMGALEEPRQPAHDMNVEKYLSDQRGETVLQIMEDGRHEILDDMNNSFDQEVDEYWHSMMTKDLKLNETNIAGLNLSKGKFDLTKVVVAGTTVIPSN